MRSRKKKNQIRVHLCQFASSNGQPLQTLSRVQNMLRTQRIRTGDWVLFPEMWPAGFLLKDRVRMEVETAFCYRWLKDFARERRCYMVGSMLEVRDGHFFNSAYVLGPEGRLLHHYRKIHLFRLGEEHRKFKAGTKAKCFSLGGSNAGIAICYDLRFPELFRIFAKSGASVVFLPSAWPKERLDHFLSLLKARAIENQCYMVGVNKIGRHDSGMLYGGHSAVFGPWGEKLLELGSGPGIAELSLDLTAVEEVRRNYPFLKSRILD